MLNAITTYAWGTHSIDWVLMAGYFFELWLMAKYATYEPIMPKSVRRLK